jgi:hypothetical protein
MKQDIYDVGVPSEVPTGEVRATGVGHLKAKRPARNRAPTGRAKLRVSETRTKPPTNDTVQCRVAGTNGAIGRRKNVSKSCRRGLAMMVAFTNLFTGNCDTRPPRVVE